MVLPDLACLIAGGYKGYMNASGVEVDSTYLAYTLAGAATLDGLARALKVSQENKDPVRQMVNTIVSQGMLGDNNYTPPSPAGEGVKSAIGQSIIGAFEIAVGYGLGWVAYHIIN